jgi:aspartate/methionine/tyrosine aminotransferase
VPPSRVVVTPGAKPVVALTLMALADPGDEVIVPDPGFPIYASLARALELVPVPLPLRAEHGFRPDLDELRALVTPRTRLLVVNSPNNPTGAMLAPADVEGLAAVAMAHDLAVLTDEIYARIVHEGEHHSLLAIEGMAERTIVLDGLSKTYAMTGWRVGWGIVPTALVEPFERLIINTFSGTAAHAQIAGAEALAGPQRAADEMLAEFGARRALLLEGLRALPGLSVAEAPGAFYLFPDVSDTGMDGETFTERLLVDAGVSVLAGVGFGDVATDHVRISYANSRANLRLALARLADVLDAAARA